MTTEQKARMSPAQTLLFEPLTALRAIMSPARGELDSHAVLVFCALIRRADARGVAWPSLELLAAETGLARSTVWDGVRALEAGGWLSRATRRTPTGKATNYTLTPLDETQRVMPRRARSWDRPPCGPSPDSSTAEGGPQGGRPMVRPADHGGEGSSATRTTHGPPHGPSEGGVVRRADEDGPQGGRPMVRPADRNCPSELPRELPRASGARARVHGHTDADGSAPVREAPLEPPVAHRDVKPANLLERGSPDFEIAQVADPAPSPAFDGAAVLELWSALYARSKRSYGAYLADGEDLERAGEVEARARYLAAEEHQRRGAPVPHGPAVEQLERELVRHWACEYLRDDGHKGFLAQTRHRLEHLARDVARNRCSLPWATRAAPVAASKSSSSAPAVPPPPAIRELAARLGRGPTVARADIDLGARAELLQDQAAMLLEAAE